MNLKQKIQLLAVLPLAIAMLLVVLVTQYQFDKLSLETATAYKESVIERRQAELKNYTLLISNSRNGQSFTSPITLYQYTLIMYHSQLNILLFSISFN